jgi:hypothetical protein
VIDIREKKTRIAINRLLGKGMTASIQRSGKKQFDLVLNFEIMKSYKTIRSCRRRILELEKIHCNV